MFLEYILRWGKLKVVDIHAIITPPLSRYVKSFEVIQFAYRFISQNYEVLTPEC